MHGLDHQGRAAGQGHRRVRLGEAGLVLVNAGPGQRHPGVEPAVDVDLRVVDDPVRQQRVDAGGVEGRDEARVQLLHGEHVDLVLLDQSDQRGRVGLAVLDVGGQHPQPWAARVGRHAGRGPRQHHAGQRGQGQARDRRRPPASQGQRTQQRQDAQARRVRRVSHQVHQRTAFPAAESDRRDGRARCHGQPTSHRRRDRPPPLVERGVDDLLARRLHTEHASHPL
jgi:hypothetical protein